MTVEAFESTQIGREAKPKYSGGVWDFSPIGLDLKIAVTDKIGVNAARTKMSNLDGQYPIQEVTFAGKIYLISASDDFEIFNRPHESWSRHKGSEAYYFLRSKDGKILGQIMLPFSKSSEHEHDGPEEYHQVHGRLIIKNSHQAQTIDTQKSHLRLPKDMLHQVHTLNETSASVIICDFTEHRYK